MEAWKEALNETVIRDIVLGDSPVRILLCDEITRGAV